MEHTVGYTPKNKDLLLRFGRDQSNSADMDFLEENDEANY